MKKLIMACIATSLIAAFYSCGTMVPTEFISTPISVTINGVAVPSVSIDNITKTFENSVRKNNSTDLVQSKNYEIHMADRLNSSPRTININAMFKFIGNQEFTANHGEKTAKLYQDFYKIGADNFANPFENNRRENYSERIYIYYNNFKYYAIDGIYKIRRTNNMAEEYYISFVGNAIKVQNENVFSNTPYPQNRTRSFFPNIVPISFSGTCKVRNY